ncbi:MarR family transcriptional regulator [Dactylosporangium fulvum]|uniref:MarR family transcriptional regulator n=1 Tax=Dactylosporangium fulvum TaxID=53359 RepID=A0ABY5W9S5_9ACTN|nr:MarR family transcriptional regulator [Dactylosporangium fulvum]UWP85969.1 MarR family transcriptional regulator [Dactylosporangium fulvum]
MGDQLDTTTGYLLARLGAQSRRRWARMLAEHQLTPHHFAVLMSLGHAGPAHQQRVSELIGVDPRNTVAVVDLLHRRGLVARAIDTADRRRHVLSLTPEGEELLAKLRVRADDVEAAMLAGLAQDDRTALHGLLAKLAATL